ncbi:hypothetical protein M3Y99_01347800 [Aphelenchoides fujianensis]|nr:hypothetical protein M3Y99_01347800 [Aphelenchoides fujianensis]
MEATVVKPKPRIWAAVRDGLNRFHLVDKMQTGIKNGAGQLVRLAMISRAHLESVRRTARGIKFKLDYSTWDMKLNLGLGTPKVSFPVDPTKMSAITRLLHVSVHLTFAYSRPPSFETVDWEKLRGIETHVNALSVYHKFDSSDFSAFIGNVAPQLKALNSTWDLLAQFPPLDLERAQLYHSPGDFSELNRHKIHRLEMPVYYLDDRSGFPRNQVISSSIKSLGIMQICNWKKFPYNSIEVFRRRFPSLEDLYINCKYEQDEDMPDLRDLSAYFTKLWAKGLEIRDRLHVAGLKRLFLTVKHGCGFDGTKDEWFENFGQVEPFNEATSTIDRFNECVRMFLKHNEPRAAKPTFVLIKGNFWWSVQEYEAEDEAMEEDEELDGSSKDAMDESDGTDEDGMHDGGVY